MSTNENYYYSAAELRAKYAYLFRTVSEIYKLYHPRTKATSKFENVVKLTTKLFDESIIDEYMLESLHQVYSKYPSLLPAVVKKEYLADKEKEMAYLNNLLELLSLTQSELSLLFHDLLKEDQDRFIAEWKSKYQ